MIDNCTRILEMAAESGDEKVASVAVTKLIDHLKSSGRVTMLPMVLRELRKIAARRLAAASCVEVADEKESVMALCAASNLGITAKHAIVNPSLIHGWRARSGGKLIDRSAKHALAQIYQKVTV